MAAPTLPRHISDSDAREESVSSSSTQNKHRDQPDRNDEHATLASENLVHRALGFGDGTAVADTKDVTPTLGERDPQTSTSTKATEHEVHVRDPEAYWSEDDASRRDGTYDEEDEEYDESDGDYHDDDDGDDAESWDNYVLEVIVRRRGTQYLCKWRGVEAPQWCERTDLEENGYVKQLQAFDLERTPKRPKGPPHLLRDEDTLAGVLPGQLAMEFGGTTAIANGPIREALGSSGYHLLRYAEFGNHKLEKKFIQTWKRDPEYEPRLCYFPACRQYLYHVQAKGITDNTGSSVKRTPANRILVASQPAEALERSEPQRFLVACLALISPRFLGVLFSESMLTRRGWVELPKMLCDSSNPDTLILIPMWLLQVGSGSPASASSEAPREADVLDAYRAQEPELVEFASLARMAVAGKKRSPLLTEK